MTALVMNAPQAEQKAQPLPITALLARVIDTLETIACRVLSASSLLHLGTADGRGRRCIMGTSTLSHICDSGIE